MARFLKNRQNTIGKAPGTLTFIGRKKMETTCIRIITYDKDSFSEVEFSNHEEAIGSIDDHKINWINIDGIHDPEVISALCTHFGISPLVQEDIVNTDRRPKMIEENEKLIVILKILSIRNDNKSIASDQITLALGKNLVVTFQEKIGELFNPIRDRLRQNNGKLRSYSADYLLYRLIDAIADNYLVSIGAIGDMIEKNEEHILSKTNKFFIREIYTHKTEISFLRKIIRPVKEVTKLLKNSDTLLIADTTQPYLDHLDDLLTHALETVDIYYNMTSDQLMVYNTNLNNRSNEVMKVLTIYASIFIPLTFIVGVYGTNFDFVPEYHLKYGYFFMWAIMLVVTVIMLFYFRRKKWL
jgi:magnesium transporter